MTEAARLATKAHPHDLSGPALRAFFNIAELWKLSGSEQMALLGLTSRSTFQSWKAGQVTKVSRDVIERISYLLGIFKGINILLPDRQQADEWVRAPNDAPLFSGRSALDRMVSGNVSDLYLVRRYIDGERG